MDAGIPKRGGLIGRIWPLRWAASGGEGAGHKAREQGIAGLFQVLAFTEDQRQALLSVSLTSPKTPLY